MRRALLSFAVAFFVCASASAQIDWITFDPTAIRTTRTDPVRLDLQYNNATPSTAMRLDLAAGGSITMTPMGGGRFTTTVSAASALFDFASDDMNRNFVGFLRILGAGGSVVSTYNVFINVLDSRIPAVAVKNRAGDARQTSRILNLYRPLVGRNSQTATQQFYAYFPDDFDFVNVVFALPGYPDNRHHIVVRNDVTGIGSSFINNTSFYGSTGHLLGLNVFPIDTLFDAGESAFSHETGHQWINYLDHPRLQPGPHWPPSTMAGGIMGFNIAGSNVGGNFPWDIAPAGAGFARVTTRTADPGFTDFDLYLMGLLPPSSVGDALLLDGNPCHNCTVPATKITINDVINTHGPRLPAWPNAQKSFHAATVIITRDRLLNDDEMALFEFFAARGEAKIVLPYTSGFARGTTKPFYLATRQLATIDLRFVRESKKRAVRH